MARIALRTILSAYVRCHPRQLVFGQNAFGKPYLSLLIPHYLQFNQSHSADQLLCVVSHTHAVGIDIERIDRSIAISALAPMLFSAPEQALFDTLPPARQHEYLFANWTRKEALVKALGTGISTPLPSIAIQPGLDQAQQLVETGDRAMFPRHWSVYDLAVMPEYAAAVVIEGTDCRPRPLMWAWQDLTPYLAGASTL
jgi:4'-phosphopantetheinyl transferase